MIFGWGTKNRTAALDQQHTLVLAYRYFHIFFLFRLAMRGRYSLATLTPQGWATRPLAAGEADDLRAKERLTVPLWDRFGMLFSVGGALLTVVLVSVIGG
jgi:hypothetical protein